MKFILVIILAHSSLTVEGFNSVETCKTAAADILRDMNKDRRFLVAVPLSVSCVKVEK